jgi:hypothetical protein
MIENPSLLSGELVNFFQLLKISLSAGIVKIFHPQNAEGGTKGPRTEQ